MKLISKDKLKRRLEKERPSNFLRKEGYTLVNVMSRDEFLKEHIPGSINIPHGEEGEFELRFDRMKEIILYCSSNECSAAFQVAQTLNDKGFFNILEFEGGIQEWKRGGHTIEMGEVSSSPANFS